LSKSQAAQPTYNNGFDLALAESKAGMVEEAESEIRLLLQNQETADLHELLGNVLEEKHNYLAAGNELQRAALIDPSESNTFAWAAELLRHQTLEPAMQVFAKGVARYPRSWRMLAGLGVTQYLLGHNEEAVTAFCAAIDLAPRDPRPYFYLSRVHGIPESQQSAVAHRFEQYLMRAPKDAKAHYYYAMNLWGSDTNQADAARLGQVKGLLQEAIARDPKFAEAHLQLGILYSGEGNDQAALAQFHLAVQLDPSLDIAHFRLGQTLIRVGQRERGQQELEQWKQLRTSEQAEAARRQKELLQFLYNPAG
jgi:tetratricopeptide (TPR) repeat protein